jgi:tripartite-type tricarboxylate transporter receptor subunit TctC
MQRRTLLAVWAVLPLSAQAQGAWPQRSVRIVVPYPPGSGTDIAGRALAERLQLIWGQPVVVENKPGAGAILGAETVARAAPDGHTLLMGDNGPLAINPSLYARLPYDPNADFIPITMLARLPFVLVTPPELGPRNVAELVALAKRDPAALTYASVGNGSATHLAMAMFCHATGIQAVHVPFRGSAPALTEVMGGRVSMMFVNTLSSLDLIQAGKLRVLAIGAPLRSPALPAVPTLVEALGDAEARAETWFGLLAPTGTDQAIIRRVAADVATAAAEPGVRARLEAQGAIVTTSTPEEFTAMIAAEQRRWAEAVRLSGARVE